MVGRAETATWFQTEAAYLFFASLPTMMHSFAYGVAEDGMLKGVVVGFVTVEQSRWRQFFTRRAIINGGPLLAEDISTEALRLLLGRLREEVSKEAIYIEMRNFNDYSRWEDSFEACGFAYQPHLNFHLDCSEESVIQCNMHESRRRQVRKGLASGAVIEEAKTEQDVRDFYRILEQLYRRKVKTPLFSLEFFLAFFRQEWGKYLLVKYEGKVIGGMMCPILEGRTIYEWYVCGLDELYREQHPSVLATYAAMQYAADHGLQRFDFMGAGKPGGDYGVRAFKAQMGGQLMEHGRFLLIAKPLLYRIGVLGVAWLRRKR
ncbi:MAG: GNAT family N-acetyltransferase [Bacteroidales bacterium]|nr:GNAT family N-acetyltransferase [Bacteroidales bacterium]